MSADLTRKKMTVIYSKTGNPVVCGICSAKLLPTTPPWEIKYHELGKCKKHNSEESILDVARALGAKITLINE